MYWSLSGVYLNKQTFPLFFFSTLRCVLFQVKEAVQLLNDLGTLQYFQNEYLRTRVVINPQWIVDVMACIVSCQLNAVQVNKLIILLPLIWTFMMLSQVIC